LKPLLVDRAMMPATQQNQIREDGRSAVGPVIDVVALTEADATARKTIAAVAIVERPPQSRRNRAGSGADLYD